MELAILSFYLIALMGAGIGGITQAEKKTSIVRIFNETSPLLARLHGRFMTQVLEKGYALYGPDNSPQDTEAFTFLLDQLEISISEQYKKESIPRMQQKRSLDSKDAFKKFSDIYATAVKKQYEDIIECINDPAQINAKKGIICLKKETR